MNLLWTAVIVVVSIYCGFQSVRDFRRGDRFLGAIGAICVLALWLVPIETRAFKLDLVTAQVRQAA